MTFVGRSSIFAATLTLFCVILMTGLGFWQLDRMHQKQLRLESINQKQSKGSLSLMIALSESDPRDIKVAFEGRPDIQQLLLLDNQIHNKQIGFDVIVPVWTNAGWLLVNFGWVAAPDLSRTLPNIDSNLLLMNNFEGMVSRPVANPMVNNDINESAPFPLLIQQAVPDELVEVTQKTLLPYLIILTQPSNHFIREYKPVVMPPEKHLGYAMQWFGLALAAAVIGGVAIFKRGRTHDNP